MQVASPNLERSKSLVTTITSLTPFTSLTVRYFLDTSQRQQSFWQLTTIANATMVETATPLRPIKANEPTESTALPSKPVRCLVKLQKLKLLPSRASTEKDESEEAAQPQGLSTPMREIRISSTEAFESNHEIGRDRAENDAERQSQSGEPIPQYLEGWRLHILTFG